jgi:WD40 repeat protein
MRQLQRSVQTGFEAGSGDNTAKLWRLSSDNSSATCVATLAGHSGYILSVAFHPTAPRAAIAHAAVIGSWGRCFVSICRPHSCLSWDMARPRGCAFDSLPSFPGYNGRQVAPGD